MTNMLKSAFLAAAAALPALAAVPAAHAQALPGAIIAVVDRERIVHECTACRTAASQFQGLATQFQQRQQTLAAPLQTQEQQLQTEANRISALPDGPAKDAQAKAFQPRLQAFQQQQASAQQELQGMQQNLQSVNANVLRQINEKMNPIIGQVMQQRGANVAVDQDATLASAKSIDVTDQVLAALNTQLTTVSVTPLPPQAGAPSTAAPTSRRATGR